MSELMDGLRGCNQREVIIRSPSYQTNHKFLIIEAIDFGTPCSVKSFHVLEKFDEDDYQHCGCVIGHDLDEAESLVRRKIDGGLSVQKRRNPRYSLLADMDKAWPRKPILKALALSVSDGEEALRFVIQKHVDDDDEIDEIFQVIMSTKRDLLAEMDWAWPNKAKLKELVREAHTLEEGRRLLVEVIRHHADEDRVAEITADIMRHKTK